MPELGPCLDEHLEKGEKEELLKRATSFEKEGIEPTEAALRAAKEMQEGHLDNLHDLYNKLGLEKKSTSDIKKEKAAAKGGEGEVKGSEPPPADEGHEPDYGDDSWTAIRKEKQNEIDAVKKAYEAQGVKTWSQTLENALSKLQSTHPEGDLFQAAMREMELIRQGSPSRAFTPDESLAAMQYLKREIEVKRRSLYDAMSSGDDVRRDAAILFDKGLFDSYNQAALAIKDITSTAGRTLNYAQSELGYDEDHGLELRRMDLMAAKGDSLSPSEMEWTEQQWDKEKAARKKYEQAVKANLKKKFDKQVEKLNKQYQERMAKAKAERGKPEAKEKKEKLLSQKGKELADKIRSGKLDGTYATVPGFPQAVNLVIEGIAQLVEKGATLAEAIQQYAAAHNIKDTDRFTDDFIGVIENNGKREDALTKIKDLAAADKSTDVTHKMVAANFIKDYVDAHIGSYDPKEVMDAAHEGLKDILPDLTKEKMMAAYLKEGEFRQPTSKELKSGLREQKEKLARLTKLDKDISDLTKNRDLYRRNKSTVDTPFDKDIAAKEKQRNQIMREQGNKFSTDDKAAKASYIERAKSHNDRLEEIGKQADNLLKDASPEDKAQLIKLKNEIDGAKAKVNPDSRISQKKVIEEANTILKKIKNDFDGPPEIKRMLREAINDFESDKSSSEQKIKLERTKKKLEGEVAELERKINAQEFEDNPVVNLTESDAALIELQNFKRNFTDVFNKKKREFERNKVPTNKRLADFARALEVMYLIGKPITMAKVGASAALKPQINVVSKATTGRLFDALPFMTTKTISEIAKAGGESNSPETIRRAQQAIFRQFDENQLKSAHEKSLADLDKSDHEYQMAKGDLDKIADKESAEYKSKQKQVQDLKKINDKNQVRAISDSMYQFMSGGSMKEAIAVLLHRTAKIDEVFGAFDREDWQKKKPGETSAQKRNRIIDNTTYVADTIGRSHAALKNFSSRSEFAAGFVARVEGALAEGKDLSQPNEILQIANASLIDWERGRYGEHNLITDGWNKIVRKVDEIFPQVAFLLRADIAITKVPVNQLKEAIMEFTLGAFTSSWKTWQLYKEAKGNTKDLGYTKENIEEFQNEMRNQLKKLSPEEAASIARGFRKGGFGLGLLGLGTLGALSFGGFPHLGMTKEDKKKAEKEALTGIPEMKTEELMIGDWEMPLWVSKVSEHVPALFPLMNGLNAGAVWSDKIKSGETDLQAAKAIALSEYDHITFSIPQYKLLEPLGKDLYQRFVPNKIELNDVDENGDPIKRIVFEPEDFVRLMKTGEGSLLSESYYKQAVSVTKAFKKQISDVENDASLSKEQKESQRKELFDEMDSQIKDIYQQNKDNPQ